MQKNVFLPADILLPNDNFEEWSVIACDQYTSEPEYWQKAKEFVANKPSALNIIFPEVYLEEDGKERIKSINNNMKTYINEGVFNEYKNTMILTRRTLADGRVRNGIVGLIDLEDYSYEKCCNALIRATEQTVTERIPPRVEIRRDAILEIPHIMLLIDDINKTVIEPIVASAENFEKVYDFNLMLKGGSIKGYAIDQKGVNDIQNALLKLKDEGEGLLFAVGDGNHSLATAKECYKLNKTENSRYALVEVVNIHDSSLDFEPIYRVVFGVEPKGLIDSFVAECGGEYFGADSQKFTCVYGKNQVEISVKPSSKLAVGTLQAYLDKFLKENSTAKIDYIHGENSVRALASKDNTVGFIFVGMEKSDLFPAVCKCGSLPRKTFSMGHADDKRFYLEARKL